MESHNEDIGIIDFLKANYSLKLTSEYRSLITQLIEADHLKDAPEFDGFLKRIKELNFFKESDEPELIAFIFYFMDTIYKPAMNDLLESISNTIEWDIIKAEKLTASLINEFGAIIWNNLNDNGNFGSLTPQFKLKLKEFEEKAVANHINNLSSKVQETTEIAKLINEISKRMFLLKWEYIKANEITSGWPFILLEFYADSLEYLKNKANFGRKSVRKNIPPDSFEEIFTEEYKEDADAFIEALRQVDPPLISATGTLRPCLTLVF
jgi:hypothetical protein